jgi:hypothetical protein
LGSAKKTSNEQLDLLTVTHQNGFRSAIIVGAPTLISFVGACVDKYMKQTK